MEVTVNRIFKYEGSGGMKAFCNVSVTVGESKITFDSMTLRESKDGKLYVAPASQQDKKDTSKWNNIYKIEGQLHWDITNAVIKAYNGGASDPTPAADGGEQTAQKSIAQAKSGANPFKKSLRN